MMVNADDVCDQAKEIRDRFRNVLAKAVRNFGKTAEAQDVDDVAFALGVEWAAMTFAAMTAILKGESKASFVGFAAAVFDELHQEKHPKQ